MVNGVERDDENWFILRLRWAEIDHDRANDRCN